MTDVRAQKLIKKIPIPTYTFGEELINTISHGLGAILGVAALTLCLVRSVFHQSGYAVASSIVFGLSLIILYSMSAIYHGVRPSIVKRILRICDHCTIFLLIAGSYTPFTLITLRGPVGWTLFGIIWTMAIVGIILNVIDLERFKKLSMGCYLVMGWCVVFTFPTLVANLSSTGLKLLIAGGIAYTVGAVIFGIGSKVKYMHSLWHFFVLAGSILHFLCIFSHVI
ncbi:MAG: hemolysin III family protein [Lachnospiraceae bacterium]|nr:hemolysin III family protein [Lachnospiraceae bacterium]